MQRVNITFKKILRLPKNDLSIVHFKRYVWWAGEFHCCAGYIDQDGPPPSDISRNHMFSSVTSGGGTATLYKPVPSEEGAMTLHFRKCGPTTPPLFRAELCCIEIVLSYCRARVLLLSPLGCRTRTRGRQRGNNTPLNLWRIISRGVYWLNNGGYGTSSRHESGRTQSSQNKLKSPKLALLH